MGLQDCGSRHFPLDDGGTVEPLCQSRWRPPVCGPRGGGVVGGVPRHPFGSVDGDHLLGASRGVVAPPPLLGADL
jgi:hypothetical protein